MPNTTNACSLDQAGQEKRLEEIAALAARALHEAQAIPRGVRLRLQCTEEVQADLWRLIEAEGECCAFLRFQMRVADRAVILDVTGPPEARNLIDRLFDLPRAVA